MPKYLYIGLYIFFNICSVQAQDQGTQIKDTLKKQNLPSLDSLTRTDSSKTSKARFLSLEKRGKNKRLRFYAGDQIIFQLKNDPNIYKPIIEAVDENSITVFETKIPLSEIEYIYIRPQRRLLRLLRSFLVIAGVGYILIDLVNHSFNPNKDVLIRGGASAGLGGSLSVFLFRRKMKLNKNRYLKTIIRF